MALGRPDLNYNEIPFDNSPKLYHQYLPASLNAATSSTVPAGGNRATSNSEIPSFGELKSLSAELEALRAAATQREDQIKSNLDLVSEWIKKYEKQALQAVAAAAAASGGSIGMGGSTTLSANGSGIPTLPSSVATAVAGSSAFVRNLAAMAGKSPSPGLKSLPPHVAATSVASAASFAAPSLSAMSSVSSSLSSLGSMPTLLPSQHQLSQAGPSGIAMVMGMEGMAGAAGPAGSFSSQGSPTLPSTATTAKSERKMTPKPSSGKLKMKDDALAAASASNVPVVKSENLDDMGGVNRKRSMSPQTSKKRKREKDEMDMETDKGSMLFRKTDDGSVKIAISQNGKMKIKISATSPPPPGVSSSSVATPIPPSMTKSHSRANTPKVPKPVKAKQRRKGMGMDQGDEIGGTSDVKKEENSPQKDGDYSKAKAPPNQIPITQFWSFCESQYFRALTDEDFIFLDDVGDDVTPFITPALGRHYLDQWAEEEGLIFPQGEGSEPQLRRVDSLAKGAGFGLGPQGPKEYEEIDDTVYGGDITMGSLTERILASLRSEGLKLPGIESDGEDEDVVVPTFRPASSNGVNGGSVGSSSISIGGGGITRAARTTSDMMILEERLKNEIRHLGLVADDEVDWDPKDDDEISQELRQVQNELLEQMSENIRRKQILKDIASYYRGWEQYNSVLDALSKQIETDYVKRYKQNPKHKKRTKTATTSHVVLDQTLDSIEKRRNLIDNIGSLFPAERVTIPTVSIYDIPKVEANE
ncbi:Transcriptional regulator [Blyttiomyces sp. JEL0837]|nr:Transcriptional regulator [Blyttiomyces sp. JEL0837]